jgi:hypothetical protein
VLFDQCAYIKDIFLADLPASISELDHRSAVTAVRLSYKVLAASSSCATS